MKIKLVNAEMNIEEVIDSLDCRILHFRNKDDKGRIMPNGGATVISIINNKTNQINVFSAKCNMKDKFARHKGIDICLRRLVGRLYTKQVEDIISNDGEFKVMVR